MVPQIQWERTKIVSLCGKKLEISGKNKKFCAYIANGYYKMSEMGLGIGG